MIAYRLTFEGPLRGDGFPRSDALTAAICASVATLGESPARLAADPPFAVSSLFPFGAGERGEPVYLFPRPLGSVLDEPMTPELRAERALVRFLSPSLFRWVLGNGGVPDVTVFSEQDGEIWSETPIPRRLWTTRERARRPFDRLRGTPAGAPARVVETVFADGAGLWFAARPRDKGVRAKLEAALRLLADEGFGRSAPFRVEVDDGFRVPTPGGGGWVLLSLYHPTAEEVGRGVLAGARYELVERGGMHTSGARRRVVRMIAEGARLAGAPAPEGAAVRVLAQGEAPGLGHDVFRSGVALCAPAPAVRP